MTRNGNINMDHPDYAHDAYLDRLRAQGPQCPKEQERPLLCRHDAKAALRTFGFMLAVSIPIWIFTPVVASFGSLLIRQLLPAIFAPDENNGSTTGDVPYDLYAQTAILLVVVAIAVLILNLTFGMRPRHGWMPTAFGVAGFVAFIWSVVTLGGAPWQWTIAPVAIILGAVGAQVLTTARDARDHDFCNRTPWGHA